MTTFQPPPYSHRQALMSMPRTAQLNPATLRKGAEGMAVAELQDALLAAGDEFGSYKIEKKGPRTEYTLQWKPGVFDEYTHDAVMRFQGAKGLAEDGVVGKNTWKALGVTSDSSSGGGAVQEAKDFVASRAAGTGDGAALTPFYEQPWFIPVAVSAAVLTIGTVIILVKD